VSFSWDYNGGGGERELFELRGPKEEKKGEGTAQASVESIGGEG